MAQEDYLIWDAADLPNVCSLAKLAGLEKTYRLVDGVPLAQGFPEGVSFRMDPDNPHDTLLADNLVNPYMVIVASAAAVDVLRARAVPLVEYLPVSIIDHKGKAVPEPYFIVHPIEHAACLDVAASGGEWDMIDPEVLDSVENVVLDEQRIEAERELFRPKPLVDVVVVRRSLAEALEAAGLTGLQWIELADYPG